MISQQSAVFIGKDRSPMFRDFLIEESFYFLFEASGMTKADGHSFMKRLEKRKKQHGTILNLQDLDIFIQEALMAEKLPETISVAAAVVNRGILYIKTINAGEIHLRRGKSFVRLIHGTKSASGYIEDGDMAVFTTSTFRSVIEQEEKLEKPLNKLSADDLAAHLEDYFTQIDDQASVAIFVDLSVIEDPEEDASAEAATTEESPEEEDDTPDQAEEMGFAKEGDVGAAESASGSPGSSSAKKKRFMLPSTPQFSGNIGKILTGIAVVVLLAIFVWSIVFGYQRRQQAEIEEQITASAESISEKTEEAEEIAFLNLDRAMVILNEAKEELALLEEVADDELYQDRIDELRQQIADLESTIVRSDEQEPDEFFDLAVESADATGDDFFRDEDRLAILDRGNDTVYNLSLSEKSLEKSSNEAVGDADLVGISGGTIFLFDKDEGVYEFVNDEDVEQVIEPAEEWGDVTDFGFFLSNIYILDPGAGDIHKYVPAGDGYSDVSSYFSTDPPAELSSGRALTIDASIYVAQEDDVVKYTRGEEDNFETVFPTESVSITGVYTDPELEKVFVWDKQQATVFVLSKNGKYERQVKASVLGEASDVTVYENEILVLSGSKIYALQETSDDSDTDGE